MHRVCVCVCVCVSVIVFYSITIITIRMTNMVCLSFCFFYAVIIYPPVSANVSAGQSAVFTCTALADVIEWTADNQPVSDHDVYAKGFHPSSTQLLNGTIGLRRSNLSVAGQEENDNVSITCVAFNKGDILESDTSDPVLLRVQGIGTAICI